MKKTIEKVTSFSLIVLVSTIFFLSCNDDNESGQPEPDPGIEELMSVFDPPMSDEFIEALDQCPTVNYTIDDFDFTEIGMSNAEEEQNSLQKLFKEMAETAIYYTNRSNFVKPSEGKGRPAQTGLAYVYGSKSSTKRYNGDYYIPVKDKNGKITEWLLKHSACNDWRYGLDCSGYMALVFNFHKIKIPNGSANDQINTLLNTEALNTPYFKGKVKIENVTGPINENTIRSGDILYRDQHIGIVLKTKSGKLVVFQSLGSPNYSCDENMKIGRGPSQKELSNGATLKSIFNNAKALRITPIILDVTPEVLNFEYLGGYKTFKVDSNFSIEMKSLDENEEICTVKGLGVFTHGDTTTYTYQVFVSTNPKVEERNTQISIKANIKGKIEEKIVTIKQDANPKPQYRIKLESSSFQHVRENNPLQPIKLSIIDVKTGKKYPAFVEEHGRAGWDSFSIWTEDNSYGLAFSIEFESIGNYVSFSYSDYLYVKAWFGHLTSGSGDKIKSKKILPFKIKIHATYYYPEDSFVPITDSPIEVSGDVEFIEYTY